LIDFSQPGTMQQRTHVQAVSGRLILARDSESKELSSSAQLVQTTGSQVDPSGVEPPVKLFVRVTNLQTGVNDVDLSVGARSFAELRRKHPREVDRYLRPILRDFAQELTIFGTDQRAQWQVLAADAQPEPDVGRRVAAVMAKFDSDDFTERENAAKELESLGQAGAIAVARMDRSTLSPEQSSAVDTFLAPYQPLAEEEVKRLRASPDYLLDCLYSDDPTVRKLAIERLRAVMGKAPELDESGSPEARAAVIERFRTGLPSATAPAAEKE
jgi:hypothetical protein